MLQDVTAAHLWLLAGVLLLGTELLLPGVFLLWVGLAAIGTGLVLLVVAPPLAVVVAIFIILLAAGIATALRLRRQHPTRPQVNAPTSGLVGRAGILLEPAASGLRVRVGDSDWAARLPRDVPDRPAGTRVRIEGVDGTTLIVRPDA